MASTFIQRLEAVRDVVARRCASPDFLPRLSESVRDLLEADSAVILLASSDQAQLAVAAAVGVDDGEPYAEVPFAGPVYGLAKLADEPLLIRDVAGLSGLPLPAARGAASLLIARLALEDETIGVLQVGTRAPGRLTEGLATLLGLVASRVAPTVASARLLLAERRARQAAEATVRAVAESEERFRLALASAPITVWAQGLDLRYTWVFNLPSGLAVEDVLGKADEDLFPSQTAATLRAQKGQVLQQGAPARGEMIWPIQGEERRYAYTLEPLRDAAGNVAGLVGAAIDVTERWRAEATMRSLEQQKEQFLTAAAHDLKNPLAAVKGFVQLLQLRSATGPLEREQVRRPLEAINGIVSQMTALVNEMLDVARLGMGQALDLSLAPTDLREVARRVVAYYIATEERPITVDLPDQPLVGNWDRERLERVLYNLLSNAVKYSPEGGPIAVRLAKEEDEQRAWAVLTVSDQGIGIPADEIDQIFERFHRARNVGAASGTGIGLASVRSIVELHGGQVAAQSELGRGSTFRVRLPLSCPQHGAEGLQQQPRPSGA